jgi:hypothetical protein
MDGKSNAIRDRITTVKNTKKITEVRTFTVSCGHGSHCGPSLPSSTFFKCLLQDVGTRILTLVLRWVVRSQAMRLVAAAKVRRAQEAVLSTRPFNEGLQSVFSGLVKRLALENIELPLLQVHATDALCTHAFSEGSPLLTLFCDCRG